MSAGPDPIRHWLEGRAAGWLAIGDRLARLRASRSVAVADALALARDYRQVARDHALARRPGVPASTRELLAGLYGELHEALHRQPVRLRERLATVVAVEVPAALREMRGTVALVTAWFVLSLAIGWALVAFNPELVSLVASEAMIDTVRGGELWTDDLLNIVPSSVLAVGILTNNVVVALFACCIGVFYGIGTLYLIGLNGLMIGAVFAFTGRYGLDGRLFEFVVAHGIVELAVICISGAVGITLGQALISPGQRSRRDAFEAAARRAARVMVVCVAFLVGAGLIEGYVSPDPRFPLAARVVIGVCYAFLLAVVVSGAATRRRPIPAAGA
jgi:uncharacterized membrane protein SpoIIM required for sporulation